MFDFVVHLSEPEIREGEPQGDLLGTTEANAALLLAYKWAVSKAAKSVYANAAKVYIEGIEANRIYEPNNSDRADYTQLLYIISNLTYWRGEGSREARQVLKDYADSIKDK
jgi:hypothetical protein